MRLKLVEHIFKGFTVVQGMSVIKSSITVPYMFLSYALNRTRYSGLRRRTTLYHFTDITFVVLMLDQSCMSVCKSEMSGEFTALGNTWHHRWFTSAEFYELVSGTRVDMITWLQRRTISTMLLLCARIMTHTQGHYSRASMLILFTLSVTAGMTLISDRAKN